ncbi:MAG: DUF418 domain-containing protein [Fimbriimonadaceae bacterium]|nr:DUF418 domain-containing protein [Fimbriimonadaceae bacterium]QYK57768.1 MAG: DUF418 domain-containing protein [Fimbriimonadaceae bacterium]
MISPTTRDRIQSLDFLRGIAVLGILWANIVFFASPMIASTLSGRSEGAVHWGEWGAALHATLVTGKFRAMLAILFGVGLWLQFVKRRSSGSAWPSSYLWRVFWLGVIGVCHMMFLWLGDVLTAYAATALVAVLFVKLSDRVLLWTAAGLLALNLLLAILLVAFSFFPTSSMDGGALFRLIESVPSAAETAIFRSGTWFDQLALRAMLVPLFAGSALFLPLNLLHLFLIGIVLARSGVLARPSASPKVRDLCLKLGFGIGLPLNALPFLNPVLGTTASYAMVNELGANTFLALGYLMLGAVAVEKGAVSWLVALFRPVGQFALTSYLLQSALASIACYSWGLRLYGQLQGWWLAGLVLAVWSVVIAFAHLWAQFATIGPVEWVWRSLSEGRRLPLRRFKSQSEAVAAA